MSPKKRRGRRLGILSAIGFGWMALWMTWSNLQTSQNIPIPVEPDLKPADMMISPNKGTRILGFSDNNYREYAVRWYHRLKSLGYSEHAVVAVDQKAVDFFSAQFNSYRGDVGSLTVSTLYRIQE